MPIYHIWSEKSIWLMIKWKIFVFLWKLWKAGNQNSNPLGWASAYYNTIYFTAVYDDMSWPHLPDAMHG